MPWLRFVFWCQISPEGCFYFSKDNQNFVKNQQFNPISYTKFVSSLFPFESSLSGIQLGCWVFFQFKKCSNRHSSCSKTFDWLTLLDLWREESSKVSRPLTWERTANLHHPTLLFTRTLMTHPSTCVERRKKRQLAHAHQTIEDPGRRQTEMFKEDHKIKYKQKLELNFFLDSLGQRKVKDRGKGIK